MYAPTTQLATNLIRALAPACSCCGSRDRVRECRVAPASMYRQAAPGVRGVVAPSLCVACRTPFESAVSPAALVQAVYGYRAELRSLPEDDARIECRVVMEFGPVGPIGYGSTRADAEQDLALQLVAR